jgi:hypothetical protein
VSGVQVTYRPRPDATLETEHSALATVYKFVLESKKAAEPAPEPDSPDAKVRSKDDSRATRTIL